MDEIDKEIDEELAKLVSEARNEFSKTGKLENFFKVWDSMTHIEQDNLVAFLIEKEI